MKLDPAEVVGFFRRARLKRANGPTINSAPRPTCAGSPISIVSSGPLLTARYRADHHEHKPHAAAPVATQ